MAESPILSGPIHHSPQEPRKMLAPDQIAMRQFVRGTFRISQGALGIQLPAIEWASFNGRIPIQEIPAEMPDYLQDLFPPGQHKKLDQEQANAGILTAWEKIHELTYGISPTPESEILPVLTHEILKMELKYQLLDRPARNNPADNHESQVRKYILQGEKTESPIIDDLCIELKREFEKLREEPAPEITAEMISPESFRVLTQYYIGMSGYQPISRYVEEELRAMGDRKVLAYVEALWEQNHPGQRFFPEQTTA